jgi:hypothetical protein
MLKRSSFIAVAVAVLMVLSAGAALATKAGDRDGDADSSPATQLEDSHEAEADASPSDNQHPSGKDRSVENGKSANQGRSESNPDDSKGPMRWEGAAQEDDKPNGLGGTDREDQDGNNGCGNDDDFDDDNNGWCGKPGGAPSQGEELGESIGSTTSETQVLGVGLVSGTTGALGGGLSTAEVLGARFTKTGQAPTVAAVQGQALPMTGLDMSTALVAAGILLALGGVLRRVSVARCRRALGVSA